MIGEYRVIRVKMLRTKTCTKIPKLIIVKTERETAKPDTFPITSASKAIPQICYLD